MKKFVFLALIAMLACGGLFGAYIVRIQTNSEFVHDIYLDLVDVGDTVPTPGIVDISRATKAELYGTWELSDPPIGYIWEVPQVIVNAGSYFNPIGNDFVHTMSFNLKPEVTPVVLSSFTATLTAMNEVQINWVTQSENNMLGYRVYRNESAVYSGAILITPMMVQATNTSQEHNYTVVDDEVEIGTTYYYWLESVEAITHDYYGPVSINVQGEVPPVYPAVTSIKNAYPNPFKTNTNIEVEVKEGEQGTVTIYNLQGKVVKIYDVYPGSHTITWNGMDSNGAACGSGIYLYKLSTPSVNQTKKMIIVK